MHVCFFLNLCTTDSWEDHNGVDSRWLSFVNLKSWIRPGQTQSVCCIKMALQWNMSFTAMGSLRPPDIYGVSTSFAVKLDLCFRTTFR